MPDYAAAIEFSATDFPGPEFRMLRRQLVPLLQASEGVTGVRTDRASHVIGAVVVVAAPSSSTAVARAGALARGLLPRLRKVRTARIRLRVELKRDERARGVREGDSRPLIEANT
ncbi:hypothetical protein HII28_08765 [Planctomonas sp. JC2975]|uniref:hypothetical protein n=1 Tax=Planctomonas sp. JC2975 TaxID=2729626 RepID=UPI0014730AE3|nr:hypothetical protein [Planctomonas sp. JC2975]NNC11971.1 hypothetical protein [Planctomonas sp. JC2975]